MSGYDIVLDQILAQLRNGTVPWRSGCNAVPRNYITGHAYRGINRILLSFAPYELPWYLTFKQVRAAGGSIRKGEHGHIVCFFKKVDEEEERDYNMVLKYYRVFNIAQTTLEPKLAATHIPGCEDIYVNMPDPPRLTHVCGIPHYAVITDTVAVPVPGLYESVEEYYSTLFHELIHSTGHPKRLMRFGHEEQALGGKESYSLEELVAEIGASFLCAETGILPMTITNNSAYIANWLKVLENNRSFIFRAASLAQKAADYITSGDNPRFFLNMRLRKSPRNDADIVCNAIVVTFGMMGPLRGNSSQFIAGHNQRFFGL